MFLFYFFIQNYAALKEIQWKFCHRKLSGRCFINWIYKIDRTLARTGKATPIRRIAVRETSNSRHHGDKLRATLKPSGPLEHYCIEWFKRGPELGPQYADRWAVGLTFSSIVPDLRADGYCSIWAFYGQ